MKRIFALLLCVLSLFAVACKDEKGHITDIDLDSSFYEEKIFVGDDIDFSDFSVLVTYSSGETLQTTSSVVSIVGFSTVEAGEIEFTIKHKNKSFKKTVVIYHPTVVDCTYKGEGVVLYKGDTESLFSHKFTALYENGAEEEVSLSGAEIADDYNLTNTFTNITFTYDGKTFVVPCKVVYKPIVESVEYKFVDLTSSYDTSVSKIMISSGEAFLFNEERVVCGEFSVTSAQYNMYTAFKTYGGSLVTVQLYLVKDTIYMDFLE
ncbi:MAG: bacterial Ig-like domain-containing protein [Clostridia bacterium]|nr:bacterial Ig-like domain-containing protein [Clostridia bacterium]